MFATDCCLRAVAVAVLLLTGPQPEAAAREPDFQTDRSDPALRLTADPRNPVLAAAVVRQHLVDYRTDGDHRHLGLAAAALAPWWSAPAPPTDLLLLRAVVRQTNHAFAEALADLDAVLARDPRHLQARLTRSFVLQTQGRLAEAAEDCRQLPVRLAPAAASTCAARIESLTGSADRADRRLDRALTTVTDPAERAWMLTVHAEVARGRGDDAAAEARFRAALATGQAGHYTALALADLLLDHGRGAEALAVIGDGPASDARLLRLALAQRWASDPAADSVVAALARRFDAADRRAGAAHLREQARFYLELAADRDLALTLAQLNWATQREPEDVRLLLAAALAAGRPDAAAPVVAWIADTGLEDPRLHALIARLDAARAAGPRLTAAGAGWSGR